MANNVVTDFDALMNASMDDLEDLPPVGVPPTGHYTLLVTASRETPEGKNAYIKFQYEVVEVGEVKNLEEAAEAAPGMKFSQMFSPFKKDGTLNDFGIGFLKEACAPFAAHFGTSAMGDTLAAINNVQIAASLVRKKDKRDEDRWNFSLKDVVII